MSKSRITEVNSLIAILLIIFISGCANYSASIKGNQERRQGGKIGSLTFRVCNEKLQTVALNNRAITEYPGVFSNETDAIPIVVTVKSSFVRSKRPFLKFYNTLSSITLSLLPRISIRDYDLIVKTYYPLSAKSKISEKTYRIQEKENESILPFGLIPIGSGKYHDTQVGAAEYGLHKSNRVKNIDELENNLTIQAIVFNLQSLSRDEIASFSDQDNLKNIVMSSNCVLGMIASEKISNQDILKEITLSTSCDRLRSYLLNNKLSTDSIVDVFLGHSSYNWRKTAFKQMSMELLEKIGASNPESWIITAARIKTGREKWDNIFSDNDKTGDKLETSIVAAAIVDSPKPTATAVVKACHNYIRQGNESHVPELRYLLLEYGDKTLAEDYLNCGHSGLSSAAQEWANKHGYSTGTGFGSHRVTWGSDRK